MEEILGGILSGIVGSLKYRSNSKAVYANKRRRRDLEALRYYESHDGLIKYTEDFGNNID